MAAIANPGRVAEHERALARLTEAYAGLPTDRPVRLAKATSNLFRPRTPTDSPGLDVSDFSGVIDLDAQRGRARVAGMTTYEDLIDALLPHGWMPLVVPQLKTITIGGAVSGLGIEASSFRSGLPHESVLEMEILTGSGEVVTARPDGEHAELFGTFPNSYGSLGYALSLTIELERTHRYVVLRHVRFGSLAELVAAIEEVMSSRRWEEEDVDFLDGVVFGGTEAWLCLGRWTDDLQGQAHPSDYTGQQIYYRSIQHRRRDVLTARDYLWRWDTDWFWCSRAFGAQQPRVRRLWPQRWLRSDVYWRIVAFEDRHGVLAAVDRVRRRPGRERVVQDVEIPLDRTAEFLHWFLREIPIEPLWLCPVQLRTNTSGPGGGAPWPLYPMQPGERYVNVGFWSAVPIEPGRRAGDANRAIEAQVDRLGGHKGLYSESFYDEATFHARYGGAAYDPVKERYDPAGRFPTLYDKAVRAR